jgi:aminoglycoside 3-N-acetyltransferase
MYTLLTRLCIGCHGATMSCCSPLQVPSLPVPSNAGLRHAVRPGRTDLGRLSNPDALGQTTRWQCRAGLDAVALPQGQIRCHKRQRRERPSAVLVHLAAARSRQPVAVRRTQLVEQLRSLGVRAGGVLLVHTSFRAVCPVEGGPDGFIAALRTAIGPEGTLVMPTMTKGESVFDPAATPTDGMGITAEIFWQQPGVLRSSHPGASFAAQGPQAACICQPQPLSPPHGPVSPVGRVHDLKGQVLLAGVGHTESTTLHLAEAVAQVPYWVAHPCVVEVDGAARTVMIPETDHCCEGFVHVDDWLRAEGLQREGKVGNANARLCDAQDIVRIAVEHLTDDPLIFLCPPSAACEECDAARATVGRSRDVPPSRLIDQG